MNLPLHLDEISRLKALEQFDILDTPPEAAFDRLTALAARLFRVPIALISLVDQDRQWFKSCYGIDTRQTPRSLSFCAHALDSEDVLVVSDATQDPRFADIPLVAGASGIRFYAGAPLRTSQGQALGTLCVLDTSPRQFEADDRKALRDMAALVMDEMELRISQKQLESREHRYLSLLEGASDIITVLDTQGTIQYESPAIYAVLGYKPEELVGRKISDFIHPDDLPLVLNTLSQDINSLSLTPRPIEFRFPHKDGSWRVLEAIGKNRLDDPSIQGIVVNSRDVTDRKRIDERLRLLESVVVHANDTVIITEAELIREPGPRILYVNEAFTHMTGYEAEEVVGRSPRFLQGEQTQRDQLDRLRHALEANQPSTVEVLNYRKDGTTFWAEMSIVPVADAHGQTTHWISIQRDVSERRQVEKDLRDAKNVAERANRAKSEFLSRMSHELRTPLNAILGFGQLLEMSPLPPQDIESVDQILRGGRHLLSLINEVLDIARIESGQMSLSLEPVQVVSACSEALALVRSVATSQGIVLQDQSQSCAHSVLADQQRLKQILINLLSNAVKYNRPHGVVTLWCEEVAQERLRICVRDQGQGIPPEKHGRLFTSFDRLGLEGSNIEGVGMGLALSQGLAQAMNGTIGFSSAVGQGSTFWLELPLTSNSPQSAQDTSVGTVADDEFVAPCQVLYIEDNLPNLQLVKRLFQQRPNIELLTAIRGEQGLEIATQERPSLILLDVNLPEITGHEILVRLRENPQTCDIPVVVISADATQSQIERLLGAGAFAYLLKPLDIKEFFLTLDAALKSSDCENSSLAVG